MTSFCWQVKIANAAMEDLLIVLQVITAFLLDNVIVHYRMRKDSLQRKPKKMNSMKSLKIVVVVMGMFIIALMKFANL